MASRPILSYDPPQFRPDRPDWEGRAPGWRGTGLRHEQYIAEKLPNGIVKFDLGYDGPNMSGGLLEFLMWRFHGEGIGFGFDGDQWIGMGSWREVEGKKHHIWVEGDSHLLCMIESYHYWWKKICPNDAEGF